MAMNGIPQGLEQFKQFILWKIVLDPQTNVPKKLPVSPHTGKVIDAHDRQHWVAADVAIDSAKKRKLGVAFVFTPEIKRAFIDLDDALLPDRSGWSPFAMDILRKFPGAAIEVSASGEGLHIFCSYIGEMPAHKTRVTGIPIEFYHESRFVALTGVQLQGDANTDHTAACHALVAMLGAPEATPAADWTMTPDPDWVGPEDDTELLARMLKTVSAGAAFGGKASFKDLFEGNVETLMRVWPAEGRGDGLPYDASFADSALATHLAFWTGRNCERIRRIMMWSALRRPKYERPDYLPRTIMRACAVVKDVYKETHRTTVEQDAPNKIIASSSIAPRDGVPFMSVDDQIKYFAGCVYVIDQHAIFTPGGMMLSPDRFKATYGGFIFNLDRENHKTTNNAWDAFIGSLAYRAPRVDSTVFRPREAPGAIIPQEGRSFVNIFWPATIEVSHEDVTPFLTHLDKLFPSERDREIILSYMAALVQYPGVKFYWAPLIQGVEGNGKTFLSVALANAVGRRYSYTPKAKEMGERFNDWLYGKMLIYVEDIYVPSNKIDFIETLKPMITGDTQEIEGKGTAKFNGEICANFILNSNHKDAIKKTANDRRYACFFTPQQAFGDIAKYHMHGDYMVKLYNWAKAQGGWAAITGFLQRYKIPEEFNPATHAHRAPTTSSTMEAIVAGMGPVEQEIMECIDEEREGFRGGWISSHYFDQLLDKMNMQRAIPRNKRRAVLQSIGYDVHPGLGVGGRVNQPVAPDGCRPRLYVRNDHPILLEKGLTGMEIAKRYTQAQLGAR